MKKNAVVLMLLALANCNLNIKAQESKNRKVLWAENVQTIIPFAYGAGNIRDTFAWNHNFKETIISSNWNAAFQYDKEKIFSTIVKAVLSGKLKAYTNCPNEELTPKEFNKILVQWDTSKIPMSAMTKDGSDGQIPTGTPIRKELTAADITQLKLNEKIEFDTITYTLTKKVSTITFFTYEANETGEIFRQNKEIFYVKLKDISASEDEERTALITKQLNADSEESANANTLKLDELLNFNTEQGKLAFQICFQYAKQVYADECKFANNNKAMMDALKHTDINFENNLAKILTAEQKKKYDGLKLGEKEKLKTVH